MRLVMLLVVLCLSGCAKDLTGTEPTTRQVGLPDPKITYLGVGGWLLNWKGEQLLFAPSFTNPGFPPFLVTANPKRIADYMPKTQNVTVLLIGHSHYDHLLDVPWVMEKYTPNAIAYGPVTAGNILAAEKLSDRFVDMEAKMIPVERDGRAEPVVVKTDDERWERRGRFRFLAIHSKHAPHVAGIDLLPGNYDKEKLNKLPKTVFGWREGTTLAWLVDLLDDDDNVAYRIHYQDSASNPPYGFPPILSDGKRVDLEIICAASTDQVTLYPEALLKVTQPRKLVVGHWEDFFGNDPYAPQLLRAQKAEISLFERMKVLYPDVVVPYPLTEVSLPPRE